MLDHYFNLLTSLFVKTTKAKLGRIAAASVFLASLISFIFSFSALAAPGDETTPGSLTLVPTIECIGVVVEYTGDNNQNNSAVLEYRESGGDWKSAPQMYADRGRGEYRGSIFWLAANTDYEVKVTFIDSADGVSGTNPVQATTKTRNDSPPSNGNTYYVATNGSDSNPGTDALPFKTIQKAANTVAAGDTVYIRTGTYNEFVDIESSGTENNYITFINYNGESVTLTGGGTLDTVIYIETQNYIRIKGLTIRSTTWGSIVISGCNDIIVEDCTFIHDTAQSESGAIMLYDGTEKCLIQRNIFHITSPNQVDNQHAVYRWRAGGGHVFRHNTVDTANNALQDGWGGGPEDVTGYSQDSDLYGNTIIGANDDGLQPEGGNVNIRVWNNRIENGLMGIGSCPALLGPIYIFRNVIINKDFYSESGGGGMYKLGDSSYGRIYSYHNTYYTTQDSHNGYTVTNGGFGNMVSRNNIIHAGRYTIEFGHDYDIEDHDFDYDNLYTTDPDRFVKWGDWKPLSLDAFQSGSGQESHGMSTDSKFANPAGGDFTLQETSPCIDKGVIIPGFNDANSPWPYSGTAPDLGAYEYDSGAAVDTTPPVRSNGQPTGDLAAGTTQTTISLTTDEAATCKYSTTAGVNYDSMPNTFTTTGGTSHATLMTGLSDGNTYNYYIRCIDENGNKNIDDFIISFNIPTAANTTVVGELELIPTFENISVYFNFSGDENGNNNAILEYREVGSTEWKPGIPMSPDRRDELALTDYDDGSTYYEANPWKNQWRAVIFWVTPNTNYQVRVTYTDPDGGSGALTATVSTLDDSLLSAGTTYYVSTAGNDNNDGLTQATAFRTIQKAADIVTPGNKVLIMPGTYNAEATIARSGTANNYVTFQSYDMDDKAVLDGQSSAWNNILLQAVSYIRIKGLSLTNPSSGDGHNILIDRSNNIIIEDNDMYFAGTYWGASGVMITDDYGSTPCFNILIQRNQITSGGSQAEKFGIHSWDYNSYGIVIRENTIIGTSMKDALSGYWHKDTFVYNNYMEGPFDDVLELEGGNMNVAAWGNTFKAGGSTYMCLGTAPVTIGPYYIFRNLLIGAGDSVIKMGNSSEGFTYFYHNTIYTRSTGNGISMFGNNPLVNNLITRNNIVDVDRYTIENYDTSSGWGNVDFDYDNLFTTASSWAKWHDVIYWGPDDFKAATGYESHGISANSEFINPASDNFTLQETSPCIDKGAVLPGFNDANSPWPYKGLAPDLGAYEYDPEATTNDPPVAVNDAYSANEDTVLDVAAPGVLGNDTDPEGATLTATKVSDPAHGTLILNANGSFTYTPEANYDGTDFFTYNANDGDVNSNTATVTITVIPVGGATPIISLSKSALNIGATTAGQKTKNQRFLISNTGVGILDWFVSDNAAWLSCTPTSGTEIAVITVFCDPSGLTPGTYNATITVSSIGASNSPQTLNVTLRVISSAASTQPFGFFDTPEDGTTMIAGAVPVTGWALDDVEVTKVEIWRDPVGDEPTSANGLVYIGDSVFVEGARPDVEELYSTYPLNYWAGWGYMMLTNFLPNRGNGTYTIHALAYDKEGYSVELGTKTITCENARSTKPFGTIDTPGQGEEVFGSSYINFGWVLTPQPNYIPVDGSTITLWIDGVNLGHPVYNQYRDDIATLFPGYANSSGAAGHCYIDTTAYENEEHTIAWSVEDSAGNTEGIGSRYFMILNTGSAASVELEAGSQRVNLDTMLPIEFVNNLPANFEPIRVRRGYSKEAEREIKYLDNYGAINVEIREVDRVELDLGEGTQYRGYLVVGDQLRSLPIGSTLNAKDGIFSWQPGPGFIGDYDFVFLKEDRNGELGKTRLRVEIKPKF